MKKFSKKLFCLMLVAVMVMAAIPFGAFAADHDYELIVKIDGVVEFDGTITYDDASALASDATTANALLARTTLTQRVGSGYDLDAVVDSRASGKIGVKITTHTHNWDIVPGTGEENTSSHMVKCSLCNETKWVNHTEEEQTKEAAVAATCLTDGKTEKVTYRCGYVTGGEKVDALGHIDENCDGVCDRTGCGASVPVTKVTYKVCVKLSSTSATLAEGKSVEYTEAQVKALDGATAVRSFLNGLGGDYAKVAGDMADNNFDKVTRELGSVDSYLYVWLKSVGSESEDTSGKIQVVYDDGKIEYRSMRVGSWYFSSSNLGLDDTWGTTQAKLKIYDANGSRTVQWDSEDNDAFVKATDYKVEVKGINRTVTIYFMKTSTANPTTTDAFATKYYEANTRLGVLPSLPDGYTGWYVGQEELTVDTVYHWKAKSVYAYPGKGVGSGRGPLFIANTDNELMKNVDVTENVQDNGLITKTGLMNTIEYQTGRKNPTVAGLFDESGWAYYLNNKNSTSKAKSSVDVGRAADRQGTQNIYVVLTNVSGGSNADTSNPKTGDTAMIGTAAIVMALATVGMGTAFYMKKKELF